MPPLRAMLLAAGRGTRLAPLTDHLPKPLIPVLNRPMMLYNLLLLRAAGVREVVVNLHHMGDLIEEVLGDGRDLGMAVTYSRERELLGTGGGLHAVRDFLTAGGGPCVVANGDSLVEADLPAVVARHRARGAVATMVLHRHAHPEAFGAVRTARDGRIVAIDRVATAPADDGRLSDEAVDACVFAGVSVLEPEFLARTVAAPSCVVRTAWGSFVEQGAAVYGDPAAMRLHDCGTPGRMLTATRDLLDDPGAMPHAPRADHRPATGDPDELSAPIHFGPDVRVGAGARIGPYVVLGAGVTVAPGARIRNVVALPGAYIEGRVEDAVVA